MSSISNVNYMKPPPQFSKDNNQMVNGISQQTIPQPSVGAQQQQQQHAIRTSEQTKANTMLKSAPNLSQYMPPPASQYMPPVTTVSPDPRSSIGGTVAPQIPSTVYANGAGAPNNLPPHMRPPGAMPLTNGNGSSVNSSRTSSPGLNSSPSHQPQQSNNQTQLPAHINSLKSSMQNLAIDSKKVNTAFANSTNVGPPPLVHNTPNTSQNMPGNFRTFALNSNAPQQPQSQHQNTLTQPNLYGTPVSPLMRQPMATTSQSAAYPPSQRPPVGVIPNANYPPFTNLSSPQMPNAYSQNQINNNAPANQAVSPQGLIDNQQKVFAPTTRRPMRPPMAMNETPHVQSGQNYPAHQMSNQSQPPPNVQQIPMQSQHPSNQQMQTPYSNTASVTQYGFNRLWGQDTVDLIQNRHILSPATLPIPKVNLHNQFQESINCHPHIMRCTVTKVPESNSLLQKSRLPLGILIHPFRDVNSLPVVQCPNIVRCRMCRTYINPFVYFLDSKMWKCNRCYRVNELPEDFQFDPATKTYGDVTRRPEVRSSTIEFIASSEYMLRPPPPAIYLFLFDVSIIAQQCGYLENVCKVLLNHLSDMPGDARTQVGFIAYNSELHFYSMAEAYNRPHEMTVVDIDDPFIPRPDNLLVNLKECKEIINDLLTTLPQRFASSHDSGSAMGAALQVAFKLMQASGGRITVFQTCLPNKGPGALEAREDPNNRSAKDVAHLNPATDFYKRFALECSGYQIAVDLFLLNQQYSDLATISGISRHSGGAIHHFPLYQKSKTQHVQSFEECFKRYLVRKIGFEAVMRIRCTRGLQVHTFHGNFFVRSTDLLSLPNVNPDAGYGMQISYEESLGDAKTVCFQAAVLYTNSEGERRIRVHTLCLPVTTILAEVMHSADQEAIVGLLSKMAVDRSLSTNVTDAREAFINATVDILSAFKLAQSIPSGQNGLLAPRNLALLPLYILALLKHPAFRVGTSTRLDDRVFAMELCKTLPLDQLMKYIYPEFYLIDSLFFNIQNSNDVDDDEDNVPDLPRLQLSAEFLDSRSIFLMDCGTTIIIYVGLNVPTNILENVLGVKATSEIPDYCYSLPAIESPEADALRRFMIKLNDDKPYAPLVQIIRDTSTAKPTFIEKLVDDRSESTLSYYEFLQHIRTQVK